MIEGIATSLLALTYVAGIFLVAVAVKNRGYRPIFGLIWPIGLLIILLDLRRDDPS